MFRFNFFLNLTQVQTVPFKYILCFGSTTVKSTNQIRNNLCIPCNSTIPNIFPNRKQSFDHIRLTIPYVLILQHFHTNVTKNRLGKIFPFIQKNRYTIQPIMYSPLLLTQLKYLRLGFKIQAIFFRSLLDHSL